jgi:hypothetical protein
MSYDGGRTEATPTDLYKVGDPPPAGYMAWHDWASVQYKGGLRQTQGLDGKWKFPQEKSDCLRVGRDGIDG